MHLCWELVQVFPIASRELGSYIFISLMYTVEVGITFPKHHRSISKEFSKINPMLTELAVNYQKRNLMEANKVDSVHP